MRRVETNAHLLILPRLKTYELTELYLLSSIFLHGMHTETLPKPKHSYEISRNALSNTKFGMCKIYLFILLTIFVKICSIIRCSLRLLMVRLTDNLWGRILHSSEKRRQAYFTVASLLGQWYCIYDLI